MAKVVKIKGDRKKEKLIYREKGGIRKTRLSECKMKISQAGKIKISQAGKIKIIKGRIKR
jgi:hypothetical protein